MKTSINLPELMEIISFEHGQPHSILGMHEIERSDKKFVSVRIFVPQAKSVSVIDIVTKEVFKANKIHEDGFFEAIITEREKWFSYELEFEGYENNKWTSRDPYSFFPTVTDYDKYLFGAGNHYKIYEKLGAHVMNVDGVDGVSFAVWAPNAKAVSVIGNFNDWDKRRNPMRVLPESGIWEIFIPNLAVGDKYKFCVKDGAGNTTDKADPYGTYQELRPATASVVYDISNYEWHDESWINERDSKDVYNSPINIYEVNFGSWRRMGEENRFMTYREAAELLVDYVYDMGYTHIELMPIEEFPFDGSWGYQVTGYYAATSRFGTPKDFMYFVDKCHQKGIGVFLDWVPAHFPKDAHGLARFDGTALYEHSDPKQGEHPDWGTLIFNYGRNEVRNFLISNALYWIEEFHIDGLRVDAVSSMLYLDYGKNDGEWIPNKYGGRENLDAIEFLKHMNSVISKKYPSVMMIAEESTAWPNVSKGVDNDGLGFSLKWNMGWMNDFLMYIKKDPIYRRYHHNNLTFSLIYAFNENFILVLSHDEVVHGKASIIGKMPGDIWQKFAGVRGAYGYMYTHPGKKLLFMGSEFGQFDEWNEARSIDWHLLEYENHEKLQLYVNHLNHLYKNEPALWQRDFGPEGFEWIDGGDDMRSIIAYVRHGIEEKDDIIVVCNFTPATYFDYMLGVNKSGTYIEILNSDDEKYGGSGVVNRNEINTDWQQCHGRQNCLHVKVPPLGTVILKRKY